VTRSRQDFLTTRFEPPGDSLEAAVARIQAEVLGVDRMGRTDSFFDFGGTSMDAIKICARIEAEAGYRTPPNWLLENDVLADLVLRIRAEAPTCTPSGAAAGQAEAG
jgi:acyl carrier protein